MNVSLPEIKGKGKKKKNQQEEDLSVWINYFKKKPKCKAVLWKIGWDTMQIK